MSLKTVLAQFGHWFAALFENLATAYSKEEPEFQAGLITASTFVQDIKLNLDKTPTIVWDILAKANPALSENVIINGLQTVANGLDTSIKIVIGDPVQTLGNIMAFLSTQTGNNWSDKLQSAAKLLAAELLPGTPIEKIGLFIQFVYTNFIQKH